MIAITVGALRSTLPIALPMVIASELVAPNAASPNRPATIHSNGARSCCRSSKRKNSRIIASLRSGRARVLAQALEVDVLEIGFDLHEAGFRRFGAVDVDDRLAADETRR